MQPRQLNIETDGTVRVFDRAVNQENSMTHEEQMTKMTTAIRQAIKVMGDRFGSTEQDTARAIQDLKASLQGATEARATPGVSPATTQPAGAA